MSSVWLWLSVPLAPLLFLLLMVSFPAALRRLIPWLWLSCLPALLCSLFPPVSFSPEFLWRGAHLGGQHVLVTAWLALTAVLWAAASAYAASSMADSRHLLRFWCFWLLSLSGNLLLVIAQDALSFYVGFSMMSLSAYGLVIHDGTPTARRAGRLYLQLAVLGEVLLLSGLLMRAHAAQGSFQFADWAYLPADPLTALLLLIGLGLKAGFWPLHVWLPLAHPAAPAPASAVLSGAMIKAGIFGIWLFLPAMPQWSEAAMLIGITGALSGVALGVFRDNAKQVLAYSSVSQMGYLLFIIGLSWQLPAQRDTLLLVLVVYAVHHGVAKAVLFLSADLLKSGRPGNRIQATILMLGVLMPALALCGLIFSSGAAAKSGLKEALETATLTQWLPWLQFGALASTLLLARVCFLLYGLQFKAADQPLPSRRLQIWASLAVAPMLLPWMWEPMNIALQKTLGFATSLQLSWPIAAGLALAVLVIWRQWSVPSSLRLLGNPFLLLSLWLARRSGKAWLPAFDIRLDLRLLRDFERRWNRSWQSHTVNRSAVLLLAVVVVAAILMLVS
jgi:formate hydrogenlyase subunit 3/multisubunit Na+/H+ antiporter MnhD subunit